MSQLIKLKPHHSLIEYAACYSTAHEYTPAQLNDKISSM